MKMVLMWLPRLEGHAHLVHWPMDEPVVMADGDELQAVREIIDAKDSASVCWLWMG